TGAFSDPIYQLPFAIVANKRLGKIELLKELNGKRLAILSGWSIIPEFRSKYPQIELVEFSNINDSVHALKAGKVDGFLDSSAILKSAIQQYFLVDMKLSEGIEELVEHFPSNYHILMQKGDQDVVEIINLAIANINVEQRTYLEEKWLNPNKKIAKEDMRRVPYLELYEFAHTEALHGQLVKRNVSGIDKYIYITPTREQGDEYFAVIVPESIVLAQVMDKVAKSVLITGVFLLGLLPLACAMSLMKASTNASCASSCRLISFDIS
ncbi:transporter substrate-binding domain-containing protein, partial [Vibrio fortis]